MTKITAEALKAKMALRTTFVATIKESAIKAAIESDRPYITVERPELGNSEIEAVLKGLGFTRNCSAGTEITLEFNDYFKALQKARIQLDEYINVATLHCLETGMKKFIINVSRPADEQPEILYYLREILGFNVEVVEDAFICRF